MLYIEYLTIFQFVIIYFEEIIYFCYAFISACIYNYKDLLIELEQQVKLINYIRSHYNIVYNLKFNSKQL